MEIQFEHACTLYRLRASIIHSALVLVKVQISGSGERREKNAIFGFSGLFEPLFGE
jgi:hypothetical protein